MSRQLPRLLVSLLLLLSPALAAQTPDGRKPAASAPQIQVPRLIRISGILSDLSGSTSLSLETITFTLYQDQAGTTALWSETQNVQIGAHGGYQVLLGADTPDGIPMSLFSAAEARWLGVRLNGQAEQPLVMFVSVPYALKAADAEALGGKPPSSYLTVDQLGSVPGKTAAKAPAGTEKAIGPITGEGVNRYLARFNGPNTLTYSRICESSTGDGIYTCSPRSALDVVGEITADRFTLRDAGTPDLWSWDEDVDATDHKSRFRLLWQPPDHTEGWGIMTVKEGAIAIDHDNPRAALDVNGFVAVNGRLSFTQDTGTTTPTFGMDNVTDFNRSTFRFYYQPGFNISGSILMAATSNRVGFFTTVPRTSLDVWGEVTATNRLTLAQDTGTTSPTWHLDNTGSLFRLYHQPNINTSGTTVLTATLSGQVGIGVYNPAHTLDVAGSVAINGSSNGLFFSDGSFQTTAGLAVTPSTHTLNVPGSVAINGSGYGLVFPDGSVQTTAGVAVSPSTHTLNVAGSVAISGSGHGLVFPDGSVQTTAAAPGPLFGVCVSDAIGLIYCDCPHVVSETHIWKGESCSTGGIVPGCSATSRESGNTYTYGLCCVCR